MHIEKEKLKLGLWLTDEAGNYVQYLQNTSKSLMDLEG